MSDWVFDVLAVFAGFVLIPIVAVVAVVILALVVATIGLAFVYMWDAVDSWLRRRRLRND